MFYIYVELSIANEAHVIALKRILMVTSFKACVVHSCHEK